MNLRKDHYRSFTRTLAYCLLVSVVFHRACGSVGCGDGESLSLSPCPSVRASGEHPASADPLGAQVSLWLSCRLPLSRLVRVRGFVLARVLVALTPSNTQLLSMDILA